MIRWIESALASHSWADPTVWLVRPDGDGAATVLRGVRPRPEDLADAARPRDLARGADRLRRRLLLRAFAAAALATSVDDVEVRRELQGRLRVVAPRPLHASVAHRDGWAALAVAQRPVGVDLETAEPEAPLPLDLLPPGELWQVETADDPGERARRFARLWTAREAYLKASGAGLAGAGQLSARLLQAGVQVIGPCGGAEAATRRVAGLLACAVVLG